jgi:hypothetical protein
MSRVRVRRKRMAPRRGLPKPFAPLSEPVLGLGATNLAAAIGRRPRVPLSYSDALLSMIFDAAAHLMLTVRKRATRDAW